MLDSFAFMALENPLDIQEVMIRADTPIDKPNILKIVENDIKPKLRLDNNCLKAT